jgi:hypothetical protein
MPISCEAILQRIAEIDHKFKQTESSRSNGSSVQNFLNLPCRTGFSASLGSSFSASAAPRYLRRPLPYQFAQHGADAPSTRGDAMLRTARAAFDTFHFSLLMDLTFGFASIVLTGPVAAKPLAAWVELVGPNREASIRAIISQELPCPALQSGNDLLQMRVRAEPGPSTLAKKAEEFPVRVCEDERVS